MGLYLVAATVNWFIPDTGVDHRAPSVNPLYLVREFSHCVVLLWRDRLGQITLATTTLFWGAAATMQFIVIDWSANSLALSLSQSTFLQGAVLVGAAVGTMLAAGFVTLRRSVAVLPVGFAVGIILMAIVLVTKLSLAIVLLVAIGACTGFFVVPMNALLQHRGHVLMGAGHSIAVQNFNENLGILVTVGMYALMLRGGLPINIAIMLFGAFISIAMLLVIWRHRYNQSEHDSMRLMGTDKPGTATSD
jgi:hypothetical protein